MSKKVLSLVIAVVLLLALVPVQSIAVTKELIAETKITADSHTKITAELQTHLDRINDDDKVPVYIWIDDIDYQFVESKVLERTMLSEEQLLNTTSEIFQSYNDVSFSNFADDNLEGYNAIQDYVESTKDIRTDLSEKTEMYIEVKRDLSREAYNKKNGDFVKDHIGKANILFQSQYSPMIICEMTKSEILRLSKQNQIASLSLYIDYDVEEFGNLNISLPAIDANLAKNDGFKGSGVKIGQIELGRPATGVSALSGKSITRRGTNTTGTDYYREHASLVAAILIGENGLAPAATLYSTSAYYNVSNNTDSASYSTALEYENIEWLVTQGVNVINRSFGSTANGVYNDFSQWIDHLVNQHNVSFVQAAGNGGSSDYVCLQSYNAIVVGGIDDRGTSSKTDDTYYASTSCKSSGNNKPDVVAPAVGFSIPEAYSGSAVDGTSFAAPHVAGMIAQMMCGVPTLKLRPDAIKAAVMASCDRKTTTESLNSLTNQEGAGVVNAVKAINSLSNVALQETYYTTTAKTISFDFYPLTTGSKTIVISWFRRVTGTGTNHATLTVADLTDFDLRVYDSSGTQVAYSISSANNVEFCRFNATSTNKYTVEITRIGSGTTSERITLAHHR